MNINKIYWVIILAISLCTFPTCDTSDNDTAEVIVIGGGLMGSSAAWKLAQAGQRVLLLEKQDSIYDSGSSLGKARIARSNNRGSDIWSYMHNETVKEVGVLIDFLNQTKPASSYDMTDIYTTSTVSYLGRNRIYDRLMSSLIRQEIDYKIATTPEDASDLFDVNIPEGVIVQREYNQYSGTINPENVIKLLHRAIENSGGKVYYNTEVLDLQRENELFHVEVKSPNSTKTKIYNTKKMVLAAGPYSGRLLSNLQPKLQELVNPQRVFLAFYKIRKEVYQVFSEEEKMKLLEGYPVINSSAGTREGSFFSMIEYYDEDNIPVIKIGGHFQRSEIDNIEEVWNLALTDKEKEWSFQNTLNYLQLLNIDIEKEDLIYSHGYSCVYSLTDTEVPIVSPALNEDGNNNSNFVIMAGMSGVGAKGSLMYGKIASDIMLGAESQDSMYQKVRQSFSLKRYLEN